MEIVLLLALLGQEAKAPEKGPEKPDAKDDARAAEKALEKAADEALEKFKTAFKEQTATVRTAAVVELAAVQHEKVMKKLGSLLVKDDSSVRIAAAKGLGEWREQKKKAAITLANGLAGNTKASVMGAIFEAIAKLQEENILPTLFNYASAKDPDVCKAALSAIGKFKTKIAIEPLVMLLKDHERRSKAVNLPDDQGAAGIGEMLGMDIPWEAGVDVNLVNTRSKVIAEASAAALQAITGERWKTSQEWEIWWARNKSTFKVVK